MSSQKHIINFLKKRPLHLALLPVFFIVSMYARYASLLHTGEMLIAFLEITAALLLVYIIFFLFYKNKQKAGMLATLMGTLVLFFGNIKAALEKIPLLGYISHYRILLPLLLLLAIYILARTKKKENSDVTTLFLNILFLLYLAFDTGRWIYRSSHTTKMIGFDQENAAASQAALPPAIYYIVPDGYPSTSYQKEVLGVAINPLDSILRGRDFFLADSSRSNYNTTAFSIAAVLSMQYLEWLSDARPSDPHDYNRATIQVKETPLFGFLAKNGYNVLNLSVFDLPGQPALEKERFLTATTTGMIFYNTLWNELKRDLIPSIFPSFRKKLVASHRQRTKKKLETFRAYNKQVVDSIFSLPYDSETPKRFVYAHLEMPHFPYFYNESGKPYPDELIYGDSMLTHKERFRNYIGYANRILAAVVDTIFRLNAGRNVIVIQSDHGITDIAGSKSTDIFRNYSAFYFPDKDYHLLYPEISNVNTFRIIFNKYFGQQLPLLKDTCFYIK